MARFAQPKFSLWQQATLAKLEGKLQEFLPWIRHCPGIAQRHCRPKAAALLLSTMLMGFSSSSISIGSFGIEELAFSSTSAEMVCPAEFLESTLFSR
ncbi:hypothetical protein [Synechococcus sp. 65AY6Li]|jgi:hypothetical protein|uniref:hypothetical protein n=1 Tax=Synechococcus sp. 65AY6Li TaxID=1351840 RepID=UPI00143C54A5|nr:hypothetical protein [Synechococcus sp. 65AY6Li]